MGHAMPCAESAHAPATILVADDAEMNRELYRRLLGRSGYNVLEARDGAEALEAIERTPPALVLLDLRMPEIDGVEVLRHLRRSHDQIALPIIIVTGAGETELAARCLEDGANDYVTKPIVWSVLRARVEAHLLVRAARAELAGRLRSDSADPLLERTARDR